MTDEPKAQDYAKEYSEESFWAKLRKYAVVAGRQLVEKGLTLYYYCMLDKDTPAWAKTVIVGALGYFILPLDAIPDFTLIAGYTDDLGAITAAMGIVAVHIKPEHQEKARGKVKQWFGEEDSEQGNRADGQ